MSRQPIRGAAAPGITALAGESRHPSAAAKLDPGIRRRGPEAAGDLPDWLRGSFVVATLLLGWVRLDPFHDLTSVANIEAQAGGSLATQVAFSLLGLAIAALVSRLGTGWLRALATPPFWLTAAWLAVSVATSVDPATSARRMILLAIAIAASATIILAARSVRHFAALLGGTALAVVLVCFVSVAVVPDLATHTALDLREPEHAGAWRGLFAHKNETGAMMAVFVFIGLFAFGAGLRLLGATLASLSAVFLLFTASKTAIAMTPLVILASSLGGAVRGRVLRAAILLGPLAILLTVTLGTAFVPAIQAATASFVSDPTFTGRTAIWEFAIDHIRERPITGWGYGTFWKTDATLYGGSDRLSWVNQADQAHQSYLDVALSIGLPGLALTVLVFVLGPFRDFATVARRGPPDMAARFFCRLWLYGILTAAFEGVFYDATVAPFFMFTVAVFGLRYCAAHGAAQR